jgi:monofunctional biosynthetic peptidoglycan transglycosylase
MKKALMLSFTFCMLALTAVLSSGWLLIAGLPDVRILRGCMTTSLYKVEICPQDESYLVIEQIPEKVIQAFLVSEDITFYQHKGFDSDAIKESILENFQSKSYKRGASTITQQLVKNAFLDSEKSILRKVREAILAYYLEREFTKDQILEKYFNIVQFGESIFGIEAAAQYYFQKPTQELSLLEGVYLAYLLPNPQLYANTFEKKELTEYSRSRIKTILLQMQQFEKAPSEEIDAALNELDNLFRTASTEPTDDEESIN